MTDSHRQISRGDDLPDLAVLWRTWTAPSTARVKAPPPVVRVLVLPPPCAPRAAIATCALCGYRDAVGREDVDGRSVAVCATCGAGGAVGKGTSSLDGPSLRDRGIRVLRRSDGMTIDELAEALGETEAAARLRISAMLGRAVRAHEVTFTGSRMNRVYTAVVR